ncbi:hypothetical protein GLOIN_2v1719772 [Rhizophagus irregularis DAOM 181602=DAOM 197198]|nr:hypothetical protein GLOIN_2v1719772 [Rhizophagus irregularis DAOM 181602=DAOM 197198]POG59732.1 hypothetical protein GLOIN_2v1719772 [Rhizophagus irregularis DAOM 181602=DAOM 197198]|eukprot:XP_025166598.1 hypothetical protein GLOIN_2v1719772 [Rhizophagus irregularis DAOM 181602=DAOM 197198]
MCHQVRHLRIHMIWSRHYEEKHIDKTGEVIHELISSQKSLVSFHLESCKAYTRIFFPLLSIHSRSLRHLKFDQVDFRGCPSWAPISDCANLQLLEIIQCTNMEPDMVRPLISNNNTPGEKFKVKYIKINHSCRELEEWVKRVNGYKQIDLPIDIQKLDEASGSNNRTKEI